MFIDNLCPIRIFGFFPLHLIWDLIFKSWWVLNFVKIQVWRYSLLTGVSLLLDHFSEKSWEIQAWIDTLTCVYEYIYIYIYIHLCVWERECVCVRERVCEKERCVWVCVRERVCERKRVCVRERVCVWERDRLDPCSLSWLHFWPVKLVFT